MIATYCIQIKGRVQGVGFRPFVHELASQYEVNGTVSNNEEGVLIYLNSTKDNAKEFLNAIKNSAPSISIITDCSISKSPFRDFKEFKIVASNAKGGLKLPLTPDFAICKNCKSDIQDPNNKRYNYPFTTCVHCGPRYAITTNFPFERANTSLKQFQMCGSCQEEYENPADRRFHSQTNSCSDCGILLEIVDNKGNIVEDKQDQILDLSAKLIAEGQIIALKNTNGYLLCCDATNAEVVKELRRRKQRPNKPFAVIFPNITETKKSFNVSDSEEKTLTSEVAPIVILENKVDTGIAIQEIAPQLDQTGVMLPHTALLYLLLNKIGRPIVATSGNIHGQPIISTSIEAEKKLNMVADYFVHHNLEISFPQDDSVVKYVNNQRIIIRRSRGLAPNNIIEVTPLDNVLATGADMKSAFALAKKEQTYISQYFGNLRNYDILQRYNYTLSKFTEIFSLKPEVVLVDKHAQYYSSQLGYEIANRHQIEIEEIQHHKAHFASILGEHDLFETKEKILGVIWDGTGLGEDNQIWGGEFFEYQNNQINRIAHFEYFNWLANDKMAKEPRLSLLSLLGASHKEAIRLKFSATEWQIYNKMLQNNQLKTSSAGRLFDAVASALKLTDYNTYEAEASMLLEKCAREYKSNDPIDFLEGISYENIPSHNIINQILNCVEREHDKAHIAFSFIYTLSQSIIKKAQRNNFRTVACSGGVFQNSVLVEMLLDSGLNIKLHQNLSPNDENIAYGQLKYFQHIKEEENVFSNSRKNKEHYITA
ncbi:MAG: carbamoyltransferase HypF [Bacteroidota bacterium]